MLESTFAAPVERAPALPAARAAIAGLGRALPARAVGNAPIAARLGVDPEWIAKRTGIRSRRLCAAGEGLAELAARAGGEALAAAGVEPGRLDAVLVATSTADDLVPQAAPLVAGALGAPGAMAWDVGLACSGFIAGLQQGAALIESGRARNVLLVGADVLGRYTDPDDRRTAALFGDGAGAALLAPGGAAAIGPVALANDPMREPLYVDRSERLVRMQGRLVYEHAVERMEGACRGLLESAGLGLDDVALVVAHQANGRIIGALRERLELDAGRVADYVGELGNTSAASIPLALSLAGDDGRLPDHGHVLLTSFGAGFSWGAALLSYGPGSAPPSG